MKNFLIALTVLFAVIATFNVQNVSAEVYQQGVVYVIYSVDGKDAVPNVDVNDNGVPDMVEDAATQINAAREVFNDVYKFPDPLKSERYKGIKSIEVVVAGRSKMKGNGVAYSGANNKSRRNPNEKVLLIKIAADLKKTNPTPAHEYFHLIQYGITRFQNSWYLEGMARWAQDVITEHKKYPKDKDFPYTLKNKLSEAKIFQGSYNTSDLLWYPLATALDDKNKIPSKIVKKYRYADGSPVFEDDIIYGANVMRQVLSALPDGEKRAVEEYGDQKKWRKDGYRNAQNNKYILDCVRAVYDAQK